MAETAIRGGVAAGGGEVSATATQEAYEHLRPHVFGIAYRMLGTVGEAEDVVQEAFLRLHRAERDGVDIGSPKGFLTTVATRIAIDGLRSARARRETYVGEWLPEPLVTDPRSNPAAMVQVDESVSMAVEVREEAADRVPMGMRRLGNRSQRRALRRNAE